MNLAADSLFMSNPDPMWIYDLETLRFLAVNKSAIAKYGYTREEFLAMTIADIRPAEDRAALAKNVAAVTEGRGESGTWRHCLKSGAVIHVDITGHTITHDGRRAELIAARDVSRLVEAEQTARAASRDLERAKRLLEIAGTSASFGAWRYDRASHQIEWSPETARIHDEPEGVSPTVDQGLAYYAPEYRDRIEALVTACLHEGTPFAEDLEIMTANGRRIWVRSTGEPERDDAGGIIAVQGSIQDISERVAAQQTASELSDSLVETLESISDAFYLLDDAWRFIFVNAQAERLLQCQRADILGEVAWDAFPQAAERIKPHYERALAGGEKIRFAVYYPALETWFEIDADPTPRGLAVYFRDVTEQRARDEQLRLLDVATSHLNDIVLITEAEPIDAPEGPRIVYVNDAFERRTGYSRDEAIGQTPRILQGPKTQREELDRIRRAMEKWQTVRSELINYTKSGEEFWLELEIVPVADEAGWFTHWVAIERDITDRKQAEQALRANEARFRLVARATGSAVWEWDIGRDTLWWSESMREIYGHAVTGKTGTPAAWRDLIHPDDRAGATQAFEALRTGRKNTSQEEFRFQRADGTWATVEDRGFVFRDEYGRVTHVMGSMFDISERRQMEDRLRQAQKMEAVGQLTAGIAHDFNNLLTIVLGNADALSEELKHQPELQTMADMVAGAAVRGAELTNHLLAFSRKQTLRPRVLDVGQLIQGMDSLLRRTMPENIEIEIVQSGGLWKTEIDPGQLESALLNLALNARDAMPDGGALTIEVANAALDDAYVASELDIEAGQYVRITVTDTGPGIPAEVGDRVFEPFFTTKEVGQGSGLGLSMVYGFVKQSGGHIRVYSEIGEGTALKLYFPRARSNQDRTQVTRAERTIAGGHEAILVVEDNDLVREHVVTQLKALGYQVFQASEGADAIEILQGGPRIDLLFTDVVLSGGMGGRDVADAARDLRPEIKVLFTSGYTENSIVHNGKLDPGVDLLSKPYRREQLAAKLRKVLDRD